MKKFALAAVGASAGGLEAFNELLRALPPDLEMALVLIQHQHAGHASQLVPLLQHSTSLPVQTIEEGRKPEPGQIYVMPAGQFVRLSAGRLRLSPTADNASEAHRPIDVFMRSLAEACKDRAIGVVLSGTASDGAEGVTAIKAGGGVTFAQDEATAEQDSMPRSAMATGCVDYVLPPRDIAHELDRLARQSSSDGGRRAAAERHLPALSAQPREYRAIVELLRQHSGVNFGLHRPSSVRRRLARRLGVHGMESLSQYLDYLHTHPGEINLLYEDLLIPATRFFREPAVFEFLKHKVLAKLLANAGSGKERRDRPLRLWSVGCSSGEETYSLAMIALEALSEQGATCGVQVFGTDLNPSGLRRARAGRYPASIADHMPAERLQRFFVKAEPKNQKSDLRVSKGLRDVCIFAQHNVAREAPFSRMDVICCRNVLIYLEPVLQRRIFSILHYALVPGGTLALGSAESANSVPEMFTPAGRGTQRKLKIFVNRAGASPPHFHMPEARGLTAAEWAVANVAEPRAQVRGEEARREADRIMLAQFAPPGVVVNEKLEVVEFRGDTSPFLELAPGAASLNLASMARGNLAAYVRRAVAQAQKTGATVRPPGLLLPEAGSEVGLQVIPLKTRRDGGSAPSAQFLVVFQATGAAPPAPAAGRKRTPRGASTNYEQELMRVRKRLEESQEFIRALSEEAETAREDHQASADEIASANEELQSSNEELETSKEELQSSNEELSTVNDELRHSNLELHQSNADLKNLIGVAGFVVVLLDRELRIRRFSQEAEKWFNLMPSDIGRRISDIRSGIGQAEIESVALSAIASGVSQRREIQDAGGRCQELSAHVYANRDAQAEGVVLVLRDVEELRQRIGMDVGRVAVDAALNPMLVVDETGEVVHANGLFEALKFGAQRVELPRKLPTPGPVDLDITIAGKVHHARLGRLPGNKGLLLISLKVQ